MKLPSNYFKPFIFAVSATFIMQFSYAQNNITANVQDGSGEPLSFANVLLLRANDFALAKGTITDETGQFLLQNIPSGKYTISVSIRLRTEPFRGSIPDLMKKTKGSSSGPRIWIKPKHCH